MQQLWIGLDRDWLAANTGRYVKFEFKILNEYRDDIIIKYRRDIFCSNKDELHLPTYKKICSHIFLYVVNEVYFGTYFFLGVQPTLISGCTAADNI